MVNFHSFEKILNEAGNYKILGWSTLPYAERMKMQKAREAERARIRRQLDGKPVDGDEKITPGVHRLDAHLMKRKIVADRESGAEPKNLADKKRRLAQQIRNLRSRTK